MKYLLYIDILGFSDLVKKNKKKITKLFKAIDGLSVHRHYDFHTIVFSDTIIVFNKYEPISEHDHQCVVMYACEFVQNLLYQTIGQDIFFRALLVYDEFHYEKLVNIEAYYGAGLIQAFQYEKNMQCCGFLISESCQRYNQVFPILPYDENFGFVYLNQSLDRLHQNTNGILPDKNFFGESCEYDKIFTDIKMLEKIYSLQSNHRLNQKIRAKHIMTWSFYHKKYGAILDYLVRNKFDPKSVFLKSSKIENVQ